MTLRVDEVRDLLELYFLIGMEDSPDSLITPEKLSHQRSFVLREAVKQMGPPAHCQFHVSDVVDKAVEHALTLIHQVNQHSGGGKSLLSQREIKLLAAQASPVTPEASPQMTPKACRNTGCWLRS